MAVSASIGLLFLLINNKYDYSKLLEDTKYDIVYDKITTEKDKVPYINMNNEDNHFLYEPNEFGMIISKDRFIKVNNRDFEYYIDGKDNILKELGSISNSIIKTKIENEQSKYDEEEKTEENTETIENTENE